MMTTKQIDLQALQQSIEKTKITTNLNEDGDVDIYFEGKKVISFQKETGHCFLGDVDLNNFLENTSDIQVGKRRSLNRKLRRRLLQQDGRGRPEH